MTIDKSDYYYGAVVFNTLFDNRNEEIQLLDTPYSHQFIKLTKDDVTTIIFMKYQSAPQSVSNQDVWYFTFSDRECEILNSKNNELHPDKINIVLICGKSELQKSHICIITQDIDVENILTEKKVKVTLLNERLECKINDIELSVRTSF